jgi:hypothetical protein
MNPNQESIANPFVPLPEEHIFAVATQILNRLGKDLVGAPVSRIEVTR